MLIWRSHPPLAFAQDCSSVKDELCSKTVHEGITSIIEMLTGNILQNKMQLLAVSFKCFSLVCILSIFYYVNFAQNDYITDNDCC